MKCPKCEVTLSITDRQGIEIDFCPQCRGIWLDRGELDKIIERSASHVQPRHDDDDRRYALPPPPRRDEHYRGGYDSHHKPYKKKSFLDDIFDF